MRVQVYKESGYEEALLGMSLSHYKGGQALGLWWEGQREKAKKRARLLAFKGGGHSKFLESIQVWFIVDASRAFWQEFDTYRVGISKQSTSTMHTLSKRRPTAADFEVGTPDGIVESFIAFWDTKPDFISLKHALPESWIQERMVNANYKVLQNIIAQRRRHRYVFWDQFIDQLLEQVNHPELLEEQCDTLDEPIFYLSSILVDQPSIDLYATMGSQDPYH
jgi:hypothetical protein